jgi:hypothetical protein
MSLTTHVTVGATVGVLTHNPWLGFVAAVASHHVLDMIPHSDPGSGGVDVTNILKHPETLLMVAFDAILAVSVMILIAYYYGWTLALLLGAFGGALPDLIDNVPFWTNKLRKTKFFGAYHWFHEKLHFTIMNKKYVWVGILTQLIVIFVSLSLLDII